MKIEIVGGKISAAEQAEYIKIISEKYAGQDIEKIVIEVNGEFVDIHTHLRSVPFQRIRRITGYLVGTLDRFNNGKKAEVLDRVPHGVDDHVCSGLLDD